MGRRRGGRDSSGDDGSVGPVWGRLYEASFETRTFFFEEHLMRMADLPDGRPVFIVADMSPVTGTNTSMAVHSLDDDERGLKNARLLEVRRI